MSNGEIREIKLNGIIIKNLKKKKEKDEGRGNEQKRERKREKQKGGSVSL